MKEDQIYVFIWAFLAFVLLVLVIFWTSYITKNHIHVCDSKNGKISESFVTNSRYGPNYSHNVDMPINTTVDCKNMCGSMGRCYITGEQCTSDVDCYGCQTKSPNKSTLYLYDEVRGQNDAGKETTGVTPTYSTLTTDIGTNAKLYNKLLIPPPKYDIGVNVWRKKYDVGAALYDERYYPAGSLTYMPVYPTRTTLSGEFEDDGPLPSNAYL